MKDEKYKEFSSKIISNIDKNSIIGVRTPNIRNYCKKIYSTPLRNEFIRSLPHQYQEENLLHGFLIGMNNNLDSTLEELNIFLPYVNNWAVCDTISPKVFKKDLNKVYINIKRWIKSKHTYTVRFAIVTLLQFYLDNSFKKEYNELVASIKSNDYYINIAIAWYFSFALIKQYDSTVKLIESKSLDKWIQNKTIQKSIESYRISSDKKAYLRTLKM